MRMDGVSVSVGGLIGGEAVVADVLGYRGAGRSLLDAAHAVSPAARIAPRTRVL
jgi:hypothetical protein